MGLTPNDAVDGQPQEGPSAAEASFPLAYGPYLLLHKLARGGMGDVFLAKTAGTMGIEKHCVVKTLRTRFTHDPEYVQRFMDEARVVVQLSHRNICPVFDVGRIGPSYYLAMELVIGRDVRSLQLALDHLGRKLSEACAVHIVSEVLDALDYAHRSVDATTGDKLFLVHRDVSPQNVLVSTEGEIKLIDFGLAERQDRLAEEQSQSSASHVASPNTGATTVMGKMSYMAPEQARGEVVDARADMFAAAIVAYELFTGERYYAGLTSQQVWQQAGAGEFRPAGLTTLHPLVRKVLEKALSPRREDRYQSCGDFREALLEYARDRELHTGARELRAIAQELFADDLKETRELLRRFSTPQLANAALAEPTVEEMFSFASASQEKIHDPTQAFRRSTGAFERPTQTTSRLLLVATAAIALLAVGVFAGVMMGGDDAQPAAGAQLPAVTPPVAPSLPSLPPTAQQPTRPPTVVAEPVAAPDRPSARRSRSSSPAAPAVGSVPITSKFAAMKRCKDPCAPRYLVWEGRLNEIPANQLKSTYELITKCYERCKR